MKMLLDALMNSRPVDLVLALVDKLAGRPVITSKTGWPSPVWPKTAEPEQ